MFRAQEVVATLTATDAVRVTIVPASMPALPARRAYELWLIPINGSPIPEGVFKPDAHGNVTVVNPRLSQGVEAKAFAITVEPETGSEVPTSAPVMLGTGE